VEAMKRGADDFLTKPVNLEKLEILIKRAINGRRLEAENESLHDRLEEKYRFDRIVGNSKAISDVIDMIKRVAPTKATILLQGETGTGKEEFATAIHQNSDRARRPLVVVHCAALPSNLLESELFGHEKGAFTGAFAKRIGRFEAAHGGTLFLDEISEIEASTQVKLLRFLETHSFERVGSNDPVDIDIRLVVATNSDLAELVKEGVFREDLFYRLNVVPITIPPLRERQEDIPLLLDYFLSYFAKENKVEQPVIAPEVIKILTAYRWPGNVRELRNFAENTVVLNRGGEVTAYDLHPRFVGGDVVEMSHATLKNPLSVVENEKRLLRNALVSSKGNRSEAADMLGISRRTLHRKLQIWPDLDVSRGSSKRRRSKANEQTDSH
jgi:DNA-binding NtrC family response regulator